LVQGMKQERHANMPTASKACFTINSSKFQMPLNSKVVSPNILHIFHFGWFWSV
jgi:hypothetical protein